MIGFINQTMEYQVSWSSLRYNMEKKGDKKILKYNNRIPLKLKIYLSGSNKNSWTTETCHIIFNSA